MNGTTVPTGRDNTYDADEVNRYESSSNSDGSDFYDAVLRIYCAHGSSSTPEITIEKGSYAALMAKLNNNRTPRVFAEVFDELFNMKCTTNLIAVYTYDSGSINFIAKEPTLNTDASSSTLHVRACRISWSSDDDITLTYF